MCKLRFPKRKRTILGLLLFCCLTLCQSGFAAEIIDLGDAKTVGYSQNLFSANNPAVFLGLTNDEGVKLLKTVVDKRSGMTHLRYNQTYRGIPVYGYHVLVHRANDGRVVGTDGSMIRKIAADLSARTPGAYEKDEVLGAMKKHFVDLRGGGRMQDYRFSNESCREVIYIDKKNSARHCFEVTFLADNGFNVPFRPHMIVDAYDLSILSSFNNIQDAEATGPGGNAKTGKYLYGKDYPYLDVTVDGVFGVLENDKIRVENHNYGLMDGVHKFTFPENTYHAANGAFCPMNDAFFFGQTTYDMFNEWTGRPPLDFIIKIGVHVARDTANAMWTGDGAVFYDGDRFAFPLVSLDVIAHEIAHGVTEHNSNLIYEYQSGGLNESFSDMAGEAAEYYLAGKNDFVVGGSVFKFEDGLRYMDDPAKDGVSIGSAKDYHQYMDVHFSSGVFNKAFYLLATTDGWNTKKAFEVFALANMAYWQPNECFVTAARGSVKAAMELGYDVDALKNAFAGVDIDVDQIDPEISPITEATVTPYSRTCVGIDFNMDDPTYEYHIYQSDEIDGTYAAVETVTQGPFSMPVYIRNLSPATSYYFKVKTVAPMGESDFSEAFTATTLTDADSPATPENLTYVIIENSWARFSWSPSIGADKYRIYYTMESGDNANWLVLHETDQTDFGMPGFYLTMIRGVRLAAIGETGMSNLTEPLHTFYSPPLNLRLTTDKRMVFKGESVTLSWRSTSAETLVASGGWNGEKASIGSFVTPPLTEDAVFELTAIDNNGKEMVCAVEVMVREKYFAWTPFRFYAPGDMVEHQGKAYVCLQFHMAMPKINPKAQAMLWANVPTLTNDTLPPEKVAKLELIMKTSDSVMLMWNDVGGDVGYYIVSMARDDETTFTEVVKTTGFYTNIFNLEIGHAYDFQVAAVNQFGRSKPSDLLQVTIDGEEAPASGAVSNFTYELIAADGVEPSYAMMKWDPVEGADAYLMSFYADTGGKLIPVSFLLIKPEMAWPFDGKKPMAINIGIRAEGERFTSALPAPEFRIANDLAPEPVVDLTVDKLSIKRGETVTLSWAGSGMKTVILSENGLSDTYVDSTGVYATGPVYGDRMFEIMGKAPHGEYVIKQVFVTVEPPAAQWGVGIRYQLGDIVVYKEKQYACRTPHQSRARMTPDRCAFLWQAIKK